MTQGRPSFAKISTQLSLPDSKLLLWSDADKSVHPEVTKLGTNIQHAEHLYMDLQCQYKTSSLDDYESV